MIEILIRNGFRSLVKQMPYSFINILGLTIGVAFMLVIIIWISVETSYDKFHKDKERLYRVSMIFRTSNKDFYDGAIFSQLYTLYTDKNFFDMFSFTKKETRFTKYPCNLTIYHFHSTHYLQSCYLFTDAIC